MISIADMVRLWGNYKQRDAAACNIRKAEASTIVTGGWRRDRKIQKARIFILAFLSYVPSPRYFAKLGKLNVVRLVSVCYCATGYAMHPGAVVTGSPPTPGLERKI